MSETNRRELLQRAAASRPVGAVRKRRPVVLVYGFVDTGKTP